MWFFKIEMRLLTLILLWLLYTNQAAPIKEVIGTEPALANAPTTTFPHTDTETESKSQFAADQDASAAAGVDVVGEEAAAAAAAEHMATAIVAPLTHIAHITYDSVPVTHKPNDHKPLFHRESHDELATL